ncbi:hypothetical protein PF010_g31688, partial [Phytophthora fragariae]
CRGADHAQAPEELLEESVVALGLPALEQDERSRGLQQRQLQLLTLSPHARSAGKSSSRGPTKHSHTYVQQLSRESARELAKTALRMRSTSIGDYTFKNPRELPGSSLRESIRRVTAFSRREPPLDTELNAVVRVDHHVRKCELRLDPDIIAWSRGCKTLGVLPTDDVVGAELLAEKAASSFCVHYFKKDRGSGAKALRRTALTGENFGHRDHGFRKAFGWPYDRADLVNFLASQFVSNKVALWGNDDCHFATL